MLQIFKGKSELALKQFNFPAGEVSVKLKADNFAWLYDESPVTILSRMSSSDDFMALAMATDAVRRINRLDSKINLFLPYIPYARQDRACVEGESFSLKVFAYLINSLNFNKVTVIDPHSYVAEGCFNRLNVISQLKLISLWGEFKARILSGNTVFVSPDAGANKKTSELAQYFGHCEFIRADKLRDLATGQIKETIVYADDLSGKEVIIADDICDGGRTFIELAKVLKAKGAAKVILYVTHGVFSQGVVTLFERGIDEVWTTNSFPSGFEDEFSENFHQYSIENLMK